MLSDVTLPTFSKLFVTIEVINLIYILGRNIAIMVFKLMKNLFWCNFNNAYLFKLLKQCPFDLDSGSKDK